MMKSRIMYIECKGGGLVGDARIGRVTFSKADGKTFKTLKGPGLKAITTMKKPERNIGFLVRRKTVKIGCTAKGCLLK
jgi:hypothetical protein